MNVSKVVRNAHCIYVHIYVCLHFISVRDAVKSDETTHDIAYFTIRSMPDIRHALLLLTFVNHMPFPNPHGCFLPFASVTELCCSQKKRPNVLRR